MQIPTNTKIYENNASIYWMGEDKIVYSVFKKIPLQPIEVMRQDLEEFKKIFGNKKHCLILDITHTPKNTKESTKFAEEEIAKITKAMALISHSILGRSIANIFFGLKPPPYPTRMFSNEEDAKQWIKQYV